MSDGSLCSEGASKLLWSEQRVMPAKAGSSTVPPFIIFLSVEIQY